MLSDLRYRVTVWTRGQRMRFDFGDRDTAERHARDAAADQSYGSRCTSLTDLWDGGAILGSFGDARGTVGR